VRRSHRLLLVLVAGIAVSGSVALVASAKAKGFHDDFTTLDTSRWLLSSRPFGRGKIDPANIAVADGELGIRLPANRLDGGEIRSRSLYQYGTYRARMRLPDAPTSLTAFFLYRAPDYQQEIDIELFNDTSGRVMFSTYSGGAQTHTSTLLLPFDATAGYHEYAIDYHAGSVRFLVDGAVMQTWSTGIPRAAMQVYANAWFPSWLDGQAPTSDSYTHIDWIDVAPQ